MDMVRIQFDIPQDIWERAERYIPDYKMRHGFGLLAFREWLTRREARDGRAKQQLMQEYREDLKAVVQEVLDDNKTD